MKLKALMVGAAAGAAMLCSSAFAAEFIVPPFYSLEVVDGETSDFNYDKDTRALSLEPGRHQIVVLFEGTFGTSKEAKLVQAANPIVIEIMNMPADASYTFDYAEPRSLNGAEQYARTQKVTLTNKAGAPLPKEQAYYYILAAESGFSILRDYRQDLMSLNRLYSPKYVEGRNRAMGMTSYGAPIITSDSAANVLNSNTQAMNITMSAPLTSSAQESNLATSSTSGGAVQGPSPELRNLIIMYENLDSETKLQFVKYVMSH